MLGIDCALMPYLPQCLHWRFSLLQYFGKIMDSCPSCCGQAERAGLLKRLRQGGGADGAPRSDAGMHAVLAGIVQEVSATQHGAPRGDAGCAAAAQPAGGVASPSGAGARDEAELGAAGLAGKLEPLGYAGAGVSAAPKSEERAEALWEVTGPPADGRQALQQRAALARGAHANRTCTELGSFWVSEAPMKRAFAGCLAAMPAVPGAQQHLALASGCCGPFG